MIAGIKVLTVGKAFPLPNCEVRHADNSATLMSVIAEFQPDVIVTSTGVPGVLHDAALELRKRWLHVDSNASAGDVVREVEGCYAHTLWSKHPLDDHLPLVSVYTPTYQSGDFLREAYQSLLEQSYKNWEWVVVDDHSTDGTWERLQSFAAEDVRVRPFRQGKRSGKIGATKDAATRLAQGAYLIELDHDDMLTDAALDEIVRAFNEHSDVGMVYSNCSSFYENGTFQRYGDAFWSTRYRMTEYRGKQWLECVNPDIYDRFGPDHTQQFAWFLTVGPHHVRAFRASTFRALGGYNPRLPVTDDWDLYARFFLQSKILHIDKMLYLYRYRDNYENATFRRNQSIQDHLALGRERYADAFRAFNARRLGLPEHGEEPAPEPLATVDVEPCPDLPRTTLRVIAIARDEEPAIRGFFEQFRGITRDFCVLDTGSADATAAVARELGARVEQTRFSDFATARNEALVRFGSSAEWIVMLDPDERLDPNTLEALDALAATAEHDIFLAPLDAVYADGSRRPFVPKPFLFKNSPEIRWMFKVHEKLVGSSRQALVRNAKIDHVLALHESERRARAEVQYRTLQQRERYFADAAYRRRALEKWPILDYDRLDDPRIAKIHAGPLVSVIIPTYRRRTLLERAVLSALAQDYATLEVVVVGDACPELEDGAFRGDSRVRVHQLERNHGQGGAAPRNHGIERSAGRLIAYLDDDNTWEPGHVSSIVLRMLESGAAFGFSSMLVDGRTLEFAEPKYQGIDTSCIVHRRELIDRHGPWKDRETGGYAHDWELVKRWLDAGEPWVATKKATLVYNAETSGQAKFLATLSG